MSERLTASQAARLVGNTGPQPVAAAAHPTLRVPEPSALVTPTVPAVLVEPAESVVAEVAEVVEVETRHAVDLADADFAVELGVEPEISVEPEAVLDVDVDDATEHHAPASAQASPDDTARAVRSLGDLVHFAQRRLAGDYSVDEFGFDPEFNDAVLMNLARPLYRNWFRVQTSGLENVPSEGAALIVANHSGTVALDSVMTQVALLDDHPAHRHLRMLGANLVFATPFVGEIARKAGHTLACNPDAERLLGSGELVGVWPEGFKGVGKPFSERYRLQRFGRGGFVAAALRSGAPIIPTAIVGAEEIYPMIGNATPLARLLGLPYFPITPTFPWLGPAGLIPLPSKWLIHFGEPIATDSFPPGAADDPMLVFDLTDRVREQIQQTIYRLLMARKSVFS